MCVCVRELTKILETPFTNISIGPPFYSMPVTQPWRLWVTKSHKPAKNDEITTRKHSETKPFACYIIYILPVSCMQSNQCAARNSSVMFAYRDKWHCSAHRHTCRLTVVKLGHTLAWDMLLFELSRRYCFQRIWRTKIFCIIIVFGQYLWGTKIILFLLTHSHFYVYSCKACLWFDHETL